MSRLLSTLFSFETLFFLFLFAGRYKGDPRFAFIPFDLTAFFFALSVLVGFFILLQRNFRIVKSTLVLAMIIFCFVSYAFISLHWSPGEIYANQKAFYVITLVFWSFLGSAFVISHNINNLKRFLLIICLGSILLATETIIAGDIDASGAISTASSNYLGIGRLVGLGVLIIIFYLIYIAKNTFSKLVSLFLLAVFMTVLLISGGRGPLIATVLAMAVPLLSNIRFNWHKMLITVKLRNAIPILAIMVIGAGVIIYLFATQQATTTLSRLSLLATEDRDASANTRVDYYLESIQVWFSSPLIGHGIGSWPILMSLGDDRDYPHNLFLEILDELGLIGFVLFMAALFYGIQMLVQRHLICQSKWGVIVMMLFINAFINSMVSADIPDNRFLFSTIGMMAIPKVLPKLKE